MTRVGCCGFPVARHTYFEKFSVVEIQSTFYDFVRFETAQKWRDNAPTNFEFILKAPQFITHPATSPTYRRAKHLGRFNLTRLGNFQPTKEVFSSYEKTRECAKILDTRILIFQSPPRFKPEQKNVQNMERFFGSIERRDLILGWESRGKWNAGAIKEVCAKLDLIDVVDPFIRPPVYGKLFYFRIHGGKGYRSKFSDDELRRLSQMVNTIISKRKKSSHSIISGYVMFNNITMFEDAQRFQKILDCQ